MSSNTKFDENPSSMILVVLYGCDRQTEGPTEGSDGINGRFLAVLRERALKKEEQLENLTVHDLPSLLTPCSRVLLEKLTSFAANQEIPRILRNPKVHYRTHNRPPPVPILSQLHPFPTTPSHFLKIHLNIILPSTSWSPQWSLSLGFPHQNLVHTSPFLHTCFGPYYLYFILQIFW